MYAFKTDLDHGVIEVIVTGFWQDRVVGTFRDALRREVAAVRAAGHVQATLYDYTGAATQSAETVAKLAELARDNPFGARKAAVFTSGKLARRQACRIAELGDHIRAFDDRNAAIDWLRR